MTSWTVNLPRQDSREKSSQTSLYVNYVTAVWEQLGELADGCCYLEDLGERGQREGVQQGRLVRNLAVGTNNGRVNPEYVYIYFFKYLKIKNKLKI